MSAIRAVQKAIKATLDAASLSAPFYDGVPQNASFPYLTMGPVYFVPDDAECVNAREVVVQIDVWGRDQGKMHPTSALVDETYDALHEVALTLDDPYAGSNARVTLVRIFSDVDGLTMHGVVQVTVMVQDTT